MPKAMKAMIVSVGGSITPLVYTLNKFKPDYIFFFASTQSKSQIEKIREKIKFRPQGTENIITPSAEDLGKCYKTLMDGLSSRMSEWKIRPGNLIPDYTGGTKTMSSALVLATIDLVKRYSYVGGKERDKDGIGVVIEGKEKMWYRKNPWDQMGVLERKKINTYFNSGRYRMAREISEKLENKVSKGEEPFYKILSDLIRGYESWDYFKHREAQRLIQKALSSLKIYVAGRENKKFLKLINTIQKNADFLNRVTHAENKNRLLVYGLLSNAERRAMLEGKFDDAVARLYRALEKIAQTQLAENYNVSTSNVNPRDLPENLKDEFETKYRNKRGRIKIGLQADYRLLREFGDEVGEKYCQDEEKIERILDIRNKSILAHGDTPVSEKTYNDLKKIVLEFANIKDKDLPRFPRLDI